MAHAVLVKFMLGKFAILHGNLHLKRASEVVAHDIVNVSNYVIFVNSDE